MSDTETSAKIKVTADTGGAVPELEKAKRSTDDLKTAAKAAGAEQKALAAEMKAGRAVIAGTTKALTSAVEATRDATLAERAFGKESREAATAQQAATAAHQAAARATEASAREVKRLEAELAKVKTEANASTPAMKRLENQLEAARVAADKQSTSLQRLQLEQQAAARAAEQQAAAVSRAAAQEVAASAKQEAALERRERLLKIVEREEREAAHAADAQAKAVAASASIVDAATQAVHKTTEAYREAALVERAFGKDSKEAAAALQVAAVQQAAAGRAAAAAAAEVKRLDGELAKMRTETNAATPAMKQLEEQLLRAKDAAEKQAKALEQLELEQRAAARGADKGSQGFDLLGAAGGKLMSVLGPAALAGSLMGVASWLGTAAEKTLQYQTAVANLPFGIEGAQKATHGLVDEQTLLAAASQAVALKVATTGADFELLAAASTKLAAKLNQPADALLSNLVTALGRGSTELLDNAGIVLKTSEAQERFAKSIGKTTDQLTDQEKATAFRVEALKAIQASADSTTVAFDGGAAAVLRWQVRFTDAMAAAERAPLAVADAIVGANAHLQHQHELLVVLQDPLGTLEQRMLSINEATRGANQAGLEWLSTLTMSAAQLEKLEDAKYKARAQGLQDKADAATDEKVRKSETARAAASALALTRDRDAREQFAKQQATAVTQGKQSSKAGASAAAKGAAAIDKGNDDVWAQFTRDASEAEAAAKEVQRVRDEVRAEEMAAEERLYEAKVRNLERELEMLEVLGEADQEAQNTNEYLLMQRVSADEQAQTAREELLMRRITADEEFARHQEKMGATEEQRLQATTRLEAAEHAKRIAATRKQVAAEQKEGARRAAIFEKVNGHITGLGESLVAAAWAQAEGEEGAVAASVSAYAKGVAQKMALKALEETALGVAALAGIVTAGLAPPHFAAAALAAAAAAAAGAAAGAFGAIASSQQSGGSASASGFRPGGSGGGGGDASASAERQQLQQLNQIPVSRETEGRAAASSPNRQSPQTARRGDTFNNIVLGATEEQVGRAFRKIITGEGYRRAEETATAA